LKTHVGAAAERTAKTKHVFVLDVIAQAVEHSEQDVEFQRQAEKRWCSILATRKTVPWDEAKAYLVACARGERPTKPKTRKPVRVAM
jgi:hypothetical protein